MKALVCMVRDKQPLVTNVTIASSGSSILLSWTGTPTKVTYSVTIYSKDTESAQTGTEFQTASGISGTTYTTSALPSTAYGKYYFAMVQAINFDNSYYTAPQSNTISVTINPPTGVTMASYTSGSTSISVSWNSVPGATSYTVNFYASGNATPVQTFTSVTSLTQASTFTLVTNTTYYASVSANNATTSSAFEQSSNTISTLPTEYTVTTLAGSGAYSYVNSTGHGATFRNPWGVTVAPDGTIYVADQDNHSIRKVTPEGVVTTLAGTGAAGSANGTGTAASFNEPTGVAVDTGGNVLVSDSANDIIRKITTTGVVSTFVERGSFYGPFNLAVAPDGNIYVTDVYNHRIRKVTPQGLVSTLAGSGSAAFADGAGTSASFNYPYGVAVAPDGTIYVADSNNHRIRKVTPEGVVSTLAGSGSAAFADGVGAGASFYTPYGLTVDANGDVIVADSWNHRIRKVTTGGVVTTLAGNGGNGYNGRFNNTPSAALAASFSIPSDVAVDASGNILVADKGTYRIRKINLINSPPSAPANVQLAYTAGDTSISVSWNSVSGATSYTVNFYASGNSTPVQTFTSVTSVSQASSFTLVANTTYYASVSANNSIGSSAFQQSNNITTAAAENTIIFTTEGTAAVNTSSSGFYITSTPNKSTVSLQETLTFTAFNIPYQPGSPYAWFLNVISGGSIASNTNPITYNFTSMGNHTIVANVNSFPINGRSINASVNSLAFTVISLYNNSKTFESIGNPTIKLTNANSSPIWINVSGPQNLGITINSTQFTITSSGQISIYISNPSSVNTITITNNTSTLITVTITNSSQYSSTATYN